ncbi:MAG: glycosyltransferase family 1 protein [bacterium]|nr:glycosyltransferase family 1 protein [bacterium]
MNKNIKRIGIDARFYGPVGKGLGRYTQEITDNIVKLDRESEYVIFLRRENFNDFKTANPKVKKVLADVAWYGWAEQILLPYYIWRERLDLMHFPHFNVPLACPIKFVVTIHDLILIRYPTIRATTLGPLKYKLKNLAYKIVIGAAIKRARKILAVSEFTKRDIIKQFGVAADKVVVTYEGVTQLPNPSFPRPLVLATSGKESGNYPYLLYVGNAYPHKNLESLIKVFSRIKKNKPELNLILVGKDDYFYARLKKFAVRYDNVIFPGYLPDGELAELYANALAYVFPSFYEGFGLPPLEAMARGLPVASSDRSCLPEILGQAALYFNPDDPEDMKNKILKIISDENLRADLRNRGQAQIKKYSWTECAEQTLEVYREILK